jgi:DNA replication protein DnaC
LGSGPAKKVELLVIDEFGQANVKLESMEWYQNVWYPVLDARYIEERPATVVITNKPPSYLDEKIGPANASRLAGLCSYKMYVVGPDNRRGQ